MMKFSSLCIFSLVLFSQLLLIGNAQAIVHEWDQVSHDILVGDYNHDGHADIYLKAKPSSESISIPYGVEITLDLISKIRAVVLLSNGDGTYNVIYDPSYATLQRISWTPTEQFTLEFMDFDGDGKNDLLIKSNTASIGNVVILAVDTSKGALIDEYFTHPGTTPNGDPEGIPARTVAVRPLTQSAGTSVSGNFSISQTGKPNYVISLETLPTPGNVRPEISLIYSGENGDSILGVGWYVKGLSAITRCKTTLIQDGYVNGVNFNSSDKYCLNGQRLVAITGQYGADGTIYRTENESFTRVVSHGNHGGSPSYFTVRKITGEIEEYGALDATYASRKLTENGLNTVNWSINKVSDREGNNVTFYYNRNNANGTHYLDRIVDANGEIQLGYEARTDFTKSHANSSLSQSALRLTSVTNYFASEAVRTYELVYDYGNATGRSRLTDIRECVSAVCTPYTTFVWDPGTELTQFTKRSYTTDGSSYPNGTVDSQHYLLADANGDGKSDLIWVYRNGDNVGRVLYLANSTGTGFTRASQQVESGYSVSSIADTDHRYLTGDVNGDGKDDLVWVARSQNELYRVIYLANSAGTGFVSQGFEVEAFGDLSGYENGRYLLADVDGDARSDLVWAFINVNTNEFATAVFLARTDAAGKATLAKTSYSIDSDYLPKHYTNHDVLAGDVNGDGKSDLTWLFTHSDKLYRIVYLANTNGSGFNKISSQGSAINALAAEIKYTVGDVNGDGKSDIIYTYKLNNSNGHEVYLSTVAGTSHTKKDTVLLSENALNHTHRNYSSADLNGDGRSDLVYTYNDGIQFGWKSYTANMDGEGFTLQQQAVRSDSSPTHQNHAYQLGDVNGDGKTDLVWTYNTSTGTLARTLYTLPQSHPDHIIAITDGLGLTTDIYYDYLASGTGTFFSKSSGAQYPVRDDNGLSYVVTHTETDNGIGGKQRFDYTYSGPKTHLTGRGFLGFESRTITDNETGFVTTERYWQQFPRIGLPQSEVVRQSNGASVEKAYYHWKTHATGLGTHFPYLKDQVAIKYDLSSAQSVLVALTENTYDLAHGNVSDSVSTMGSGFSGVIDSGFNPEGVFTASSMIAVEQTISTHSNYLNNISDTWRIGFLSDRTVTYSAPGESNRVLKSSYTPYNASSFLTKIDSQYDGSGVNLTKTFIRDTHGNITDTTISGDEIVARSDTTTVYNYGIYPNDQRNDKGHTEFFVYNKHTGRLETHTDINGLITDTLFDDFGRLLLTKTKNGSEIKSVYAACGIDCPLNAAYKVSSTETHAASALNGAPITVAYFDKLHRLLRTDTQSFDGSMVRVDREYDARGRLDRMSVPYTSGIEAAEWIHYVYDDLNRITSSTQPDGGQIATSYSDGGSNVSLATTVTKVVLPDRSIQSITSRVERNAIGQIKKVEDGENIVSDYKYNAQGHLRWVRVDNNPATDVNITTDIAGNRIWLDDPDVGTINYDYDAAGLLRGVAHADGATVSTNYDTLNRIKNRTDTSEGRTTTSSWSYDSPANGLGQIDMIIGPDYYKKIEYDDLGRIKQTATRLFGEASGQSFHYRYDPFSRLKTQQYPDGFKVETRYNHYGYKSELLNANTKQSYWLATASDKWGNTTHQTYGNGIQTQQQYNSLNGYLESIKTGPASAEIHVQNLGYNFDTAGNLRSRSSNAGYMSESLLEIFTYDDLYRLKSASTSGLNSGNRILDYDYDNLGNIIYKSDVSDIGGYAYGQNGGGVHALSRITKGSTTRQYHYDTRGNMITSGERTIAYTAYNKPNSITGAGVNTQLSYGPDRDLIHQYTNNQGRITDTKSYENGLYEIVNEGDTTRRKAYVDDFMLHTTVTVGAAANIQEIRYLHKDHIGSTDAITDESATVISRMTFAPFGARRDDNWQAPSVGYQAALADLTFESTSQGFTGHQQLDASGFIHMGGRMYDPAAGRFLSADTYVQFPELSQNYNRYSYVLNNPLSHTDPSGEAIPLVVYAGLAIWRAYSAYDTVTNGVENAKTLVDENASGSDKAAAALDLASRASGVKTITQMTNKVFSKAKKLNNVGSKIQDTKGAAKTIEAKAPKAKGKDANTQNSKEANNEKLPVATKGAPEITKAYKRPSGATTKAQRDSVQGKPCVDCGATTPKQYADHKDPLVKEYYRTGTIDKTRMRDVDSVQPQCPTCSNKQGAEMSRFSRQQKKDLGL